MENPSGYKRTETNPLEIAQACLRRIGIEATINSLDDLKKILCKKLKEFHTEYSQNFPEENHPNLRTVKNLIEKKPLKALNQIASSKPIVTSPKNQDYVPYYKGFTDFMLAKALFSQQDET